MSNQYVVNLEDRALPLLRENRKSARKDNGSLDQ